MDREEALLLLRGGPDGVARWNHLGEETRASVNLRRADLSHVDLGGVDFSRRELFQCDLRGSNLTQARLRGADLRGADLRECRLESADLCEADLYEADLSGAILFGAIAKRASFHQATLVRADFYEANLNASSFLAADLSEALFVKAGVRRANFAGANLTGAKLREAALHGTDLSGARLGGASLYQADLGATDLAGADLTDCLVGATRFPTSVVAARGLERCEHRAPSFIAEAVRECGGRLPASFLRGCGLSDWEVEGAALYDQSLPDEVVAEIQNRIFQLRCNQPLQLRALFISYSHGDREFVDAMEPRLAGAGIRYWRDVHDMTSGPMDDMIEAAMRSNPTVLLVLSESSVKSDWVEAEATLARELERELGRHVLCPITLDTSWLESDWSRPLRAQVKKYNVLDFSGWREDSSFEAVFQRLVRGLDVFYKA